MKAYLVHSLGLEVSLKTFDPRLRDSTLTDEPQILLGFFEWCSQREDETLLRSDGPLAELHKRLRKVDKGRPCEFILYRPEAEALLDLLKRRPPNPPEDWGKWIGLLNSLQAAIEKHLDHLADSATA